MVGLDEIKEMSHGIHASLLHPVGVDASITVNPRLSLASLDLWNSNAIFSCPFSLLFFNNLFISFYCKSKGNVKNVMQRTRLNREKERWLHLTRDCDKIKRGHMGAHEREVTGLEENIKNSQKCMKFGRQVYQKQHWNSVGLKWDKNGNIFIYILFVCLSGGHSRKWMAISRTA